MTLGACRGVACPAGHLESPLPILPFVFEAFLDAITPKDNVLGLSAFLKPIPTGLVLELDRMWMNWGLIVRRKCDTAGARRMGETKNR